MNVPETLEQYLIQFLSENKDKEYPNNYNDIVNAAQIINDHYFPQQEELDDKDSYIDELESECDSIESNANDVISDIRSDIVALENIFRGKDEIDYDDKQEILEIITQMRKHCDNWCY